VKRFFRWFDGFRVLKFLNFASLKIPRIGVHDAALQLLKLKQLRPSANPGALELLLFYREMEKKVAWVSHLPQ
jgi:hypothetical protein